MIGEAMLFGVLGGAMMASIVWITVLVLTQ